MSQKKVDAYKARKGQHNKADKKEKMLFGLEMFAWVFICVVIVAWIGYSAYVKVTGSKENVVQNTVMDTTALDNYISNLSTDASDGTDSTDADTAEEEDTTASTDTAKMLMPQTQQQMFLKQILQQTQNLQIQKNHPMMQKQRRKMQQTILQQIAQTLNKV